MPNDREISKNLTYLATHVTELDQAWKIQDSEIKAKNPLMKLLKRCIRKSVYWLIRPYWEQQCQFNRTVAASIADLYRLQSEYLRSSENTPYEVILEDPLEKVEGRRIIQLVSSLNFGDAVGNEVIAFKYSLQKSGYATEIYANYIHSKIPAGTARFYKDMPKLRKDDLVIYHFASECAISKDIQNFPCKVVLRFHNITPPKFFHGFDASAEKNTTIGLKQVEAIMPYIDYCLPVSVFNQSDLQNMGYTCPMTVLPILIKFEDYAQKPDEAIIRQYSDGITNLMFLGRIAPNKKIEDVISAFASYKKHYDAAARLFLVGSYQEKDSYYQFLQKHIKKLGVKDVIFPGHTSFHAILAYYKIADVFLCMSEHEGFCVPLVEAMYFGVPIIAYSSTAIPDTLGGSGVLLQSKEPAQVAAAISKLMQNPKCRESILIGQKQRLEDFSNSQNTGILNDIIEKICLVRN